MVERAAEGAFGAFFEQNPKTRRFEQLLPFGRGFNEWGKVRRSFGFRAMSTSGQRG
jgi:hypothetical protein